MRANAQGMVAATADTLDLTGLRTTGLRVGMTNVQASAVVDWARLLSQRIPAELAPKGTLSGSATRADAGGPGSWQGEFHGAVEIAQPDVKPSVPDTQTAMTMRNFFVVLHDDALVLTPVNIWPSDKVPPLQLSARVTMQGFSSELSGTATAEQIATLSTQVPPLMDGVSDALPGDDITAMKVDVACTRSWGGAQSCVVAKAAEPKVIGKHHR